LSYEIIPIAEQVKKLSGGVRQLLEELESLIPLVEEYNEDDLAEFYLNGFTYGADHTLRQLGHIMTEVVRTRRLHSEWCIHKDVNIEFDETIRLVLGIANLPLEVFQETAVRSEGTPSVVCI
tara:strand:+ start:357 stop:722 length:366 start_codon:yes stop_codon:yes gene_type:complete